VTSAQFAADFAIGKSFSRQNYPGGPFFLQSRWGVSGISLPQTAIGTLSARRWYSQNRPFWYTFKPSLPLVQYQSKRTYPLIHSHPQKRRKKEAKKEEKKTTAAIFYQKYFKTAPLPPWPFLASLPWLPT